MSNKQSRGKNTKSEQSLLANAFASKPTPPSNAASEPPPSNACVELSHGALKELREAIKADVAAMKDEILSELRSSISTLQATVSVHTDKISDIETSLTDVDGRVGEIETCYAALQDENSKLYAKLDSLENFSRRNTIRITGLEEKVEGIHPTAFMEKFLIEV